MARHKPAPKPTPAPEQCLLGGTLIYDRFDISCQAAKIVLRRFAEGIDIAPYSCQFSDVVGVSGSCLLPAINADDVMEHWFSLRPRG